VASVRPMTSLAAVGRRNGEARDYDGIRITDPSCNFKKSNVFAKKYYNWFYFFL